MIPLLFSLLFFQTKEWKDKLRNTFKKPWLLLFVFYFAFILVSTVFSRRITNPYKSVLEDFGVINNGTINREFIENVLLFIPYSFLFLQAFKPKSPFGITIVVSVLTTLFIEASQLFLWLGNFQLSDLVHNVLGGLIGYGVWAIISRITVKG